MSERPRSHFVFFSYDLYNLSRYLHFCNINSTLQNVGRTACFFNVSHLQDCMWTYVKQIEAIE